MPLPEQPKLYHIVHVDRLPHIIAAGCLYSDARMQTEQDKGPTIGMSKVKTRRLTNPLASHKGLSVGACVPFYFCPRSVMLYVISRQNNPDLSYKDGQGPIVHLEVDLYAAIAWAAKNDKRWAFTTSNAGAYYFDDYCSTDDLNKIDWSSVEATSWQNCRDAKQAEFLLEDEFPWALVERVGVLSSAVKLQVTQTLAAATHKPLVAVLANWYY